MEPPDDEKPVPEIKKEPEPEPKPELEGRDKAIPFVRMVMYAVLIFATIGCVTLFGAVSCLQHELNKVSN